MKEIRIKALGGFIPPLPLKTLTNLQGVMVCEAMTKGNLLDFNFIVKYHIRTLRRNYGSNRQNE